MDYWINIKEFPPSKNGVYWAYPTTEKKGYSAMYWNGSDFSTGATINLLHRDGDLQREHIPSGITHYMEIRLQQPALPKNIEFGPGGDDPV